MNARPETAGEDASFRSIFAAERLRSARFFNLLRFLGVSVFFALTLWMGVVLDRAGWRYNDWPLFTTWWLAAGLLAWFGRRSDGLARLGAFAIPLVDMPAICLLQWTVLEHTDEGQVVVAHSAGLYVLLILGASAALEARWVLLAGVIAAALEAILQRKAGMDPVIGLNALLMMPLAALASAALIDRTRQLVARVSTEQLRRERLGRYFSPQVAELLASAPGMGATGESREVTVLFLDLRDFTSIAERLDGPRVVALLNGLHARLVETLFRFGGTLDKYLGDGLMAYFGAPVAGADHAERAVRCALAMLDAVEQLNAEHPSDGEPALHVGIGIHTGTVILGDIGAPQRREYTIIGDAVNVAARLQELTKVKGVPILVSERTRDQAGPGLHFDAVGAVEVRGRGGPLEVYAPRSLRAAALASLA